VKILFKGIANSIGADTGNLSTWLKRFEYYGEKAFEKAYTIYSALEQQGHSFLQCCFLQVAILNYIFLLGKVESIQA
jgi:hypothetical protein